MGSSQTPQQLPLIDLSWLDPSQAEASGWDAARAVVMRALETFGCFEAIYDQIRPELRASLFDEAMEEVFSLPIETKMGNNVDYPYGGFIGNLPGMAYESLRVDRVPALDSAQRFTRLMWPAGNPSFCNTVWNLAKHLQDLEQIVRRMILQSMGIEKHMESFTAELTNGLRLSKYWLSPCQGVEGGMNSHTDPNFLTIICQHEVQGLEVKTRENTWISVMPLPNTFTVMLGEAFEPWTNGRLKAPVHRVRVKSKETRYSALFGSRPRNGGFVQAPQELIDENHPSLFKPFDYDKYVEFKFSEEGKKVENSLKAFCGIGEDNEV